MKILFFLKELVSCFVGLFSLVIVIPFALLNGLMKEIIHEFMLNISNPAEEKYESWKRSRFCKSGHLLEHGDYGKCLRGCGATFLPPMERDADKIQAK